MLFGLYRFLLGHLEFLAGRPKTVSYWFFEFGFSRGRTGLKLSVKDKKDFSGGGKGVLKWLKLDGIVLV